MNKILIVISICYICIDICKAQEIRTLKDSRDGKAYHTVKIGNQDWMTEDLKTTFYNNGDVSTPYFRQFYLEHNHF
jgi:hypothetical protein